MLPDQGITNSSGQPDRSLFASAAAWAGLSDKPDFNALLVKESFTHLEAHAQNAMEYFYAHLFLRHPEIRAMFPLTMSHHRERVFAALARLVWSMDSPGPLGTFLAQLGRDHRKFGVRDKHYRIFFEALLETVRHFSGSQWTAEIAAAWAGALAQAAAVMSRAAAQDAALQPPWWLGEVIVHDQRGPSLAVLTIRPDRPLRYRAGQYVSVQVPRWPRTWRSFSVANAPRGTGLLDLHVRAVPGGMVSTSLVHRCQAGDTILLGPARGDMTAPADPRRDLVCIAGGTGLAPVKAIVEDVIASAVAAATRPRISLFFGARREDELYDLADLRALAAAYPPLSVIPVVSDQPDFAGVKGLLPEVARQLATFEGSEVYVCGPDAMVAKAARLLAGARPVRWIRRDPPPGIG